VAKGNSTVVEVMDDTDGIVFSNVGYDPLKEMIALMLNKISKATVRLKNPARMDLKSRRSGSQFIMFEKLAKCNFTG
jgi:hypothetical protein